MSNHNLEYVTTIKFEGEVAKINSENEKEYKVLYYDVYKEKATENFIYIKKPETK